MEIQNDRCFRGANNTKVNNPTVFPPMRLLQVKVLGPNTGGVLGLDFLNRYDLDLNFETNEARFYVAGAVDQGLVDTSLLEGLKCGSLPGGKLAIKMELNG